MSLRKIKTFFSTYKFKDEKVILNEAETITNPKKYYETQIKILEAQTGKKAYLPYYDRLKLFYNKIQSN